MITIIPIEPISNAHAVLIVEAFNMFFIDGGGWPDGNGDGVLHGFGNGDGIGVLHGFGDGDGIGVLHGFGDGDGIGDGYGGGKCPEAWRAD